MANSPLTRSVVVSLSGGMDSTSLLLHFLARQYRVFGVSFNYGQKHSIEIAALKRNLKYLSESGLEIAWQLVDLSTVTPMLHSAADF
ncbi:MAG: 7-cyano-7-deazaguanine synthase [Pirellulaceae bacterium]